MGPGGTGNHTHKNPDYKPYEKPSQCHPEPTFEVPKIGFGYGISSNGQNAGV